MRTEGTPSMNPTSAAERAQPTAADAGEPEAIDFVRFCYRRRRVGWPELYDEMCAVAGRGLYRGYSADDLSGIGIGFALYEMPGLATIVQRVVTEDQERHRLKVHAVRALYASAAETEAPAPAAIRRDLVNGSEHADSKATDKPPRLAIATAGA
jgi:hypothetical protein